MKTRNIFRNLLLASFLFMWFFGFGSWSDFLGFMSYGLFPADKPAVSAPISSETENLSQNEPVKNQFMQQQQPKASKSTDASDRIHVEDNANLRNRID